MQTQTILDEIISGGQLLETSSTEVMKTVEEITKCSLFLSSSAIFAIRLSWNVFQSALKVYNSCRLEAASSSSSSSLLPKSLVAWRQGQ